MSERWIPLPTIDMLIDATVGHSLFSSVDGFSGCNQIICILMRRKRRLQDSYRQFSLGRHAVWSQECWKNLQQVMTPIFYDMLHDSFKDYVDVVVQSREIHNHVKYLKRVLRDADTCLEWIPWKVLWMFPLKNSSGSRCTGTELTFTGEIMVKGEPNASLILQKACSCVSPLWNNVSFL